MVTNLPKFSLTTPIVHQFAKVFSCQNFALFGGLPAFKTMSNYTYACITFNCIVGINIVKHKIAM